MIKQLLARLLPQKNHFHGGLHITPPRHKSMSTGAPSRAAALSAEYAISLRQRDGSAYLAKVAPGERVLRGQLLAEPVNSQDAPVHAPTSGAIRAIEPRPEMHPANLPVPHLILESDGKDKAVPPLPTLDPETTDADTLRERIAACGIVGLGGANSATRRTPWSSTLPNASPTSPATTYKSAKTPPTSSVARKSPRKSSAPHTSTSASKMTNPKPSPPWSAPPPTSPTRASKSAASPPATLPATRANSLNYCSACASPPTSTPATTASSATTAAP